jgi:hypothetical protein
MLVLAGSAVWIYGHAANWVGRHTDLLIVILSLSLADARATAQLHLNTLPAPLVSIRHICCVWKVRKTKEALVWLTIRIIT